jgi:hypothetical protein
MAQTDRQTNSFIENSIEAGILLGGNGILHAMLVARAVTSLQRTGINHSLSLPFSFSSFAFSLPLALSLALSLSLSLALPLSLSLPLSLPLYSAYTQCFGIRAGSPLSRAEIFCLAYGLMALRCVLHVRSSAPVVVPSASSASITLPAGHLLHIVGETDPSRECWCAPSVSALGAAFG